MICIPEWRKAILSCAVIALPFVAGCGGGDDPGPINVPQCSGSACGPSGSITTPPVVTKLCPDALDYTTTYTGGAGSGEYVKVKFDSTKMTYQMQFIESSVPTSAGQVNNTRAGMTISGAFHHPTNLPTAEQNRCAAVLDSGVTSDGAYAVTINRADPPMLFIGNGVVGGGIPGATIGFAGLNLGGMAIGYVPSRTFDFYPFIGFIATETDFSKVAGNYNEVGIHLSPLGGAGQSPAGPVGWEPDVVNWNQTFNADGTCTITQGSDYSCQTTGAPWTLRKNADGSADNVFVSNGLPNAFGVLSYPMAGQATSLILLASSQAKGIMIVGKLNGVRIPVVIRVGYTNVDAANPLMSVADAEVGISMLSSATAIGANSLKGGYIGATSASACGIVTSPGVTPFSATPAGPSFNPHVPHPDLPGEFINNTFNSIAGSCNDGTAVSTMAANYTSTLFQGSTAAFIDPQTSGVTSQFGLDYTQATPGKIKVTATQDFNAKGPSGNVAIFKKGDTGWLVTAGNVYAMVVNNSQVNPFFTVGAFVQ
ncbi:DUF2957 domain-containing protein [Burkholderia sp. D-99]|uniref:DUF2957 domain-containing protein n=1 Tax=Burkholderia sp. D-99 TaxID=2717316 RepID=UPI00141FF4B8|nr:DUF2957 domain-containing protein [Burkholderia sp. D-99]NHV31620.1 DUF2957 domain-containing protein [Burkholderia sp. D-99]